MIIQSDVKRFADKAHALRVAKRDELLSESYRYVVRCTDGREVWWEVALRAPFLGEWYDADGLRHG